MDTDISVIIDASGSMHGITDDTIGGFNSWLKETVKGVKQGDDVRISVTRFNTLVNNQVEGVPLQACPKLGTQKNPYVATGGTALLDAVGITLEAAKRRVKKGKRGLALIITDGHENSSRMWNHRSLGELMAKLEKSGRWSFVYMGADFDAFAQARTYSPNAVAGQSIYFDKAETRAVWTANAGATSSYLGGSQMASENLGTLTEENLRKPTEKVEPPTAEEKNA